RTTIESLPVLAAAPGGRFLAVAGNKDHRILVFTIADLLNQRGEPQVLHSAGASQRYVAFVSRVENNEKKWGIALSETGKSQPGEALRHDFVRGDMIYDFS